MTANVIFLSKWASLSILVRTLMDAHGRDGHGHASKSKEKLYIKLKNSTNIILKKLKCLTKKLKHYLGLVTYLTSGQINI
jgi:hypothetical protein